MKNETNRVRFVKKISFKPGVKERGLWMSRVVNQKRKKYVIMKE